MSAQTRGLFRWAGGKARIVETLFAHIEPCIAPHCAPVVRWIEPFVGSGAMALAAMRRGIAREYVLADALPDIATTLHTLARPEAWRAVEETLSRFAAKPIEEQKRVFFNLAAAPGRSPTGGARLARAHRLVCRPAARR